MPLPISPFLYLSSNLATLKISFRNGFFFELFMFSLSAKKADNASIVTSSNFVTFRFSFWISACCLALGSTTILRM